MSAPGTSVSREAIFAALFAVASTAAGFTTKSRSIQSWADVPAPNQPALFQLESKQHAKSAPRQPTVWTFHAELYVYAHATNTRGDVVTLLNTLVDAIVAALLPGPAQETQTLGGIVTDVRIDGDIETDEGRLGQQAVAIIPVLITATA